jgi:superfamily II DNA or RNA helicase/HKD family nuclease
VSELLEGAYDLLVSKAVSDAIADLPPHLKANISELSNEEAVEYLTRELAVRVRTELGRLAKSGDTAKGELALLASPYFLSTEEGDSLRQARLTSVHSSVAAPPTPPKIPLSQSALITNDQEINYHQLIRDELSTADHVDFICPFIGNQGVNLLIEPLKKHGNKLRIITTTYLGGTHLKALQRLAEFGAQIKIVFEQPDQKTSLHAKAWIFHRKSGFTTCAIGSSNLSVKALVDGLEWNVRVGSSDAPQLVAGLTSTFDRLWADARFELFDPKKDSERVGKELRSQSKHESGSSNFYLDVRPFPHQQEALDALRLARESGRHQNLVVAATGTGKTLLSAFDYRQFSQQESGHPKLLYVAHREDILKQSIGAFRFVLRDQSFGETNVGSDRSFGWTHVFASVQSLAHMRLEDFTKDHFAYIVVDEFHHAEAQTYSRVLDYFQPKQLVGLTATPERTDGAREQLDKFWPPTYELRLWHALHRKLLCPFHYFGVDDETDLSGLSWSAGKYNSTELDELFEQTLNQRSRVILRELSDKVEVESMVCVAFCASKRHADMMQSVFAEAGIESASLHSDIPKDSRAELVQNFRKGKIKILCTVDLFNEGVDIPEINTVLFLRPTESAIVFIQQLGRGLRNHHSKGALTVLDFVGNQNAKFRFDQRFSAMTGLSRRELELAVSSGFPKLPAGCDIRLDKVVAQKVIRSLREAIPTTTKAITSELRRMLASGSVPSLHDFLLETGLNVEEFYQNGRSFFGLLGEAGLSGVEVSKSQHRIASLSHVNDQRRASEYLAAMSDTGSGSHFSSMVAQGLASQANPADIPEQIKQEFIQVLNVLNRRADTLPAVAEDLPFSLWGLYNRDEIVAPFRSNTGSMRQGTFYVEPFGLDIHMFTLEKSEGGFTPTTRYQDWFESPDRLHWESQSTTTVTSNTGQRLISGSGRHLFFARVSRGDPFMCIGFGKPISFDGERPIRLVWQLENKVPDHHYVRFQAAAG